MEKLKEQIPDEKINKFLDRFKLSSPGRFGLSVTGKVYHLLQQEHEYHYQEERELGIVVILTVRYREM